jgi:hypothetical protein
VRLADDGLQLVGDAGQAGYLGAGQVLGDLGRGDVGSSARSMALSAAAGSPSASRSS